MLTKGKDISEIQKIDRHLYKSFTASILILFQGQHEAIGNPCFILMIIRSKLANTVRYEKLDRSKVNRMLYDDVLE